MFYFLYNEIIYRPLVNLLVIFYNFSGYDFGIAIILLTILIRLLFYPLTLKSIKSQKILKELQPKLKEIQKKYKNNKEEQTKKMFQLYKDYKVNPFSGCLPILIQLPILIALYQIFLRGINGINASYLYSFLSKPEVINLSFLGILNLAEKSYILAILAGVFQYLQTKMLQFSKSKKDSDLQKGDFISLMNKQMTIMFPVLTVFIAASLPSALALYWVVSNVFSIFQQYFVLKHKNIEIYKDVGA